MKALRFAAVIGFCLALLLALGSVGGYEVGNITTPQMFACCVASLGLLWASVKIYNKVQEKEKEE